MINKQRLVEMLKTESIVARKKKKDKCYSNPCFFGGKIDIINLLFVKIDSGEFDATAEEIEAAAGETEPCIGCDKRIFVTGEEPLCKECRDERKCLTS